MILFCGFSWIKMKCRQQSQISGGSGFCSRCSKFEEYGKM